MAEPKIDAVQMTRQIREQNSERLRGLSHAERLAHYREQALRMQEQAEALLKTKLEKPAHA